MPLVRFNEVSLNYSDLPLFDKVSFTVEARERLAIIGRNGVGKSTLLKMIVGETAPDSGLIENKGVKIAQMPQQVVGDVTGNVRQYIAATYVKENEWDAEYPVDRVINQLKLEPLAKMSSLSGGQLRRCLLAKALVNEPDVLLLDEPTNHLDLPSIKWLEDFLLQCQMTIILITHDRTFLQKVANGIIEIDRGNVTTWRGDYFGFLQHKEHQLAAEEKQRALFDKKLAQEEVWIRQGIKARRTRNEGRVRKLMKLRDEYAARRQRIGNMNLHRHESVKSGKQVFIVENLTIAYDHPVVSNFSTIVQKGDKVGIIGANGCGKSSLVRCLLGELAPAQGTVEVGTKLEVAYFDQQRAQLDMSSTAIDVVGQGRNFITIGGKEQHIISYLQDFLFTPDKARGPISKFSGGECNRLLLAKLFSTPANLLVLDEPTNDLDMESLELLEEYLLDFTGTVLLISHDRSLLNNVVSHSWIFADNARITEHVGSIDDAELGNVSLMQSQRVSTVKRGRSEKSDSDNDTSLTYDERKELNRLPDKIDKLEKKLKVCHEKMAQPDFYQRHEGVIAKEQQLAKKIEDELEQLNQRWEALMSKE